MFLRDVAAVVFPLRCPGCGRTGDPVCAACARRLRLAPAAPPPAGVDAWIAPFAYDGVARELVARVKYRQVRAALPWLAAAVAGAIVGRFPPGAFDAVTWVPTVPDRRRARGFDHAELLAGGVASDLALPLRRTLTRRPGPPQTGLPRTARRAGPELLAPRAVPVRLLVVDDVATTGATLASAARALRSAGARRIVAATAARTPAYRRSA